MKKSLFAVIMVMLMLPMQALAIIPYSSTTSGQVEVVDLSFDTTLCAGTSTRDSPYGGVRIYLDNPDADTEVKNMEVGIVPRSVAESWTGQPVFFAQLTTVKGEDGGDSCGGESFFDGAEIRGLIGPGTISTKLYPYVPSPGATLKDGTPAWVGEGDLYAVVGAVFRKCYDPATGTGGWETFRAERVTVVDCGSQNLPPSIKLRSDTQNFYANQPLEVGQSYAFFYEGSDDQGLTSVTATLGRGSSNLFFKTSSCNGALSCQAGQTFTPTAEGAYSFTGEAIDTAGQRIPMQVSFTVQNPTQASDIRVTDILAPSTSSDPGDPVTFKVKVQNFGGDGNKNVELGIYSIDAFASIGGGFVQGGTPPLFAFIDPVRSESSCGANEDFVSAVSFGLSAGSTEFIDITVNTPNEFSTLNDGTPNWGDTFVVSAASYDQCYDASTNQGGWTSNVNYQWNVNVPPPPPPPPAESPAIKVVDINVVSNPDSAIKGSELMVDVVLENVGDTQASKNVEVGLYEDSVWQSFGYPLLAFISQRYEESCGGAGEDFNARAVVEMSPGTTETLRMSIRAPDESSTLADGTPNWGDSFTLAAGTFDSCGSPYDPFPPVIKDYTLTDGPTGCQNPGEVVESFCDGDTLTTAICQEDGSISEEPSDCAASGNVCIAQGGSAECQAAPADTSLIVVSNVDLPFNVFDSALAGSEVPVTVTVENKGGAQGSASVEAGIYADYLVPQLTGGLDAPAFAFVGDVTQEDPCGGGEETFNDRVSFTLDPGQLGEVTLNLVAPQPESKIANGDANWDSSFTLLAGTFNTCGEAYIVDPILKNYEVTQEAADPDTSTGGGAGGGGGGLFCGDERCTSGETATSCEADCGFLDPGDTNFCGNTVCDAGEDKLLCPSDCGPWTCEASAPLFTAAATTESNDPAATTASAGCPEGRGCLYDPGLEAGFCVPEEELCGFGSTKQIGNCFTQESTRLPAIIGTGALVIIGGMFLTGRLGGSPAPKQRRKRSSAKRTRRKTTKKRRR